MGHPQIALSSGCEHLAVTVLLLVREMVLKRSLQRGTMSSFRPRVTTEITKISTSMTWG